MSLETPNEEIQNSIEHNDLQYSPEGKGGFTAPQEAQTEPAGINLIAVGIRSAFLTVVAAVLLFGCFVSFFPYTAMRMYSSLDLKYMALVSAEKYLSRNADEYDEAYVDAFYLAANNSIYFFEDEIAKNGYGSRGVEFYARKADKYAGGFVEKRRQTEQDRDARTIALLKRTTSVDEYSLRNTFPAMHPYVYSYLDKLEVARFKAWYALGDYESMNDRRSEAVTYWGQENWEITLPKVENPELVASDFLFLSQLSAYINAELENLGLKDIISGAKESGTLTFDIVPESLSLYCKEPFKLFLDKDFTPLYDTIKNNYEKFVKYIKDNATKYSSTGTETNLSEHLKHTYYLKCLSDFTYSMHNMFAVLRAKQEYFDEAIREDLRDGYNDWENRLQVDGVRIWAEGQYQTRRVSIKQWFNLGMLQDYMKI